MGKDSEREQRLAEALRENLRRRKAQQRAGAGQSPGPEQESDGPAGEGA
jgi:hypothetical protein